jgi:hypothetical protein
MALPPGLAETHTDKSAFFPPGLLPSPSPCPLPPAICNTQAPLLFLERDLILTENAGQGFRTGRFGGVCAEQSWHLLSASHAGQPCGVQGNKVSLPQHSLPLSTAPLPPLVLMSSVVCVCLAQKGQETRDQSLIGLIRNKACCLAHVGRGETHLPMEFSCRGNSS